MILGEVMTAFPSRGYPYTTSNVEPVNLYKNGLQRSRFVPAIDQIYTHCDVHEIDPGQIFGCARCSRLSCTTIHWAMRRSKVCCPLQCAGGRIGKGQRQAEN